MIELALVRLGSGITTTLTFAYTQLSLSVQGSHSSHMGHMMVVLASQISLLKIQQCTDQNHIE